MKALASILLTMSITIAAMTTDGEAGWKQRGWYQKRPGANCIMRKVVVSGMNGKVIVNKVRVCR
ncbi:hypothetical protein [Rhizobium sp.]